MEALGAILSASPRGVLVFRIELVDLLRMMDREGREGDRASYLEAWNGSGRFTYDRVGRGTVDIEAACASILGGIQPGPLADDLAVAVHGGSGDDGLIQRFQLVVWPDAADTWRTLDPWPDTEAKREAHEVLRRLDELAGSTIGGSAGDLGYRGAAAGELGRPSASRPHFAVVSGGERV